MHDPRHEQTVAQVLDKRAAAHGSKTWIVCADGRFTFAEMRERSLKLAAGLHAADLAKGETALMMLPDGIDILTVWLALARIGIVEVPVNTHLKGGVLEHVLVDSDARVLVTASAYLERIEPLLGQLPGLQTIVLSDIAPGAVLPEITGRTVLRLADLMAGPVPAALPPPPGPTDLVAVMYTSGTTGRSKGVMVTHIHSYEYAHCAIELLEMTADDIYYSPLPLFHIAGQWATVYCALIAGCTVVVPGAFSLQRFWQDVARHGATCTFLLGAMANWLSRQPPAPGDADTPMERMLVVPLLPEVEEFKARFGVQVSTTWGSTEINVPMRSTFTLADNKTCGRVAEDRFEVRIVDDLDNEQPHGVPGEAVVRSKEPWLLMAGYWRNPEATLAAFRNQWVRSGDMMMRDAAGNFYFVDRVKDAIRRRGENISSMEVEAEILAHEAVLECAVFPVAAADSEQEVMAVLALKPGAVLAPGALLRFLEPRMAYFMLPRYVDFVAEMPKTPTGKIQKFVLRELGVTVTTWDRDKAGYKVRR